MKVILTGSIAFDYLMQFPGLFKDHLIAEHLDKVSLSFLVHKMIKQDGGVGPNIAYTLAMLGGKAYLFSTAGQDFGEYARRLEQVGVDTSGVRIIPDKFTASFLPRLTVQTRRSRLFIPAQWRTRRSYLWQRRILRKTIL